MSGLVAAVRIARRDARGAWGRSLLVVALIALPVLGVSLVATLVATSSGSPQTRADMRLGQADALLDVSPGTAVVQAPDPDQGGWVSAAEATAMRNGTDAHEQPPAPPATRAAADALVRRVLPSGSRVVSRLEGNVQLRRADGGQTETSFVELAYDDPMVRGLVTQLAGRAPRTASEISVSSSLAETAGLRPGSTTAIRGVAHPLTVVGVVRLASAWDRRTAFGLPGAALATVAAATPQAVPALPTYYVSTPQPVSWQAVQALNAAAVVVTSRSVLLNPPPDSAVPYLRVMPRGDGAAAFTPVVVVVGMALLEVVLLAGPAFAVGARRSRRELALVAATGASRRQVAGLVLARALVLGVVAALLGVAAGVSLAVVAHPFAERLAAHDYGPTQLPLGQLVVIALVGVATSLLAAAVPAWQASRLDIVAALAGRRAVTRTSRRAPVAGVLVTIAGAGVAALGAWRHQSMWILGGSMVAEVGLVITMPALVGLAGRAAPLLPLSPRLALRDASRNRMRSAPAVAAVMAAAAGSVAVGTYLASFDAHDRADYAPRALPGQAVLYGDAGPAQLRTATQAAASALPVARRYDVRALGYDCGTDSRCVVAGWSLPTPCTDSATSSNPATTSGCRPIPNGLLERGAVVLAPDEAQGILGTKEPAAADALRRGTVLVSSPRVFDPGSMRQGGRGNVTFSLTADGSDSARQVTVPAALLPSDATPIAVLVVPPSFMAAHHIATRPFETVLDLHGPVDDVTLQRAKDAVDALGEPVSLTVEQGYASKYGSALLALAAGAGLVTLGAAGIATALAITDARPDLTTLAAVGASPRVRRRLAAAQSGVVAALGALLGVVAGLVPGAAVVWALGHAAGSIARSDPHWSVIVPWQVIGVVAVAVPLVAAVVSGSLVRARIPLERVAG